MADGELYPINLDPHVPGTTLPGGVNPRGSIGGSDVGANPRDDQRVRDLVEEYMEQYQILQQLNFLNVSGGGHGFIPLVTAYRAGAVTITRNSFESGSEKDIILDGSDLLVEFGAEFILATTTTSWEIVFNVNIDGEGIATLALAGSGTSGTTKYITAYTHQIVSNTAGNDAPDLIIAGGLSRVAPDPEDIVPLLAAGAHTWNTSVGNDQTGGSGNLTMFKQFVRISKITDQAVINVLEGSDLQL